MKQLLLLAPLATAACTTTVDAPSLALRAIESRPETTTQTPAAPPLPITASLTARLAGLLGEARSGEADFARIERSDAAVLAKGQGAPPGSEAWISTEVVRSALQVSRQRSAAALAEIDGLAIAERARAASDGTVGGLDEIATTQSEIDAIVARLTARLDKLTH